MEQCQPDAFEQVRRVAINTYCSIKVVHYHGPLLANALSCEGNWFARDKDGAAIEAVKGSQFLGNSNLRRNESLAKHKGCFHQGGNA